MSDTILETSRLTLRKMIPADVAFIAEMLLDSETAQFYGQNDTYADAEQCQDCLVFGLSRSQQ